MLVRRESEDDVEAVAAVTRRAFGGSDPVEVRLLAELRASDAWLPELSLVALGPSEEEEVVGHVVCTRAHVEDTPALGLGPISVDPAHQGRGVGGALMHAVLGAADALGEPAVVLLGDPGFYRRFGFRPAAEFGVTPPVDDWAPHFQLRPLAAYTPALRGRFAYAEPFERA